jgi:hypothetical protein
MIDRYRLLSVGKNYRNSSLAKAGSTLLVRDSPSAKAQTVPLGTGLKQAEGLSLKGERGKNQSSMEARKMDEKCVNCSEIRRCKDSNISWVFFAIGLIATIAVRIVIVLMNFNPVYAKIAWYIGVGGFFIFFAYKFRINQARSKLIVQNGLVDKLANQGQLSKQESELVRVILCGVSSNKERMNYLFIFVLSAVALITAFYFDFIK